jgi:hypothetical protein
MKHYETDDVESHWRDDVVDVLSAAMTPTIARGFGASALRNHNIDMQEGLL